MVSKSSKQLLVEAGWFAGLTVALLVVSGATLALLESRRSAVPELQREVERKERSLREPQPEARALADVQAELAAAAEMTAAESERVSVLSAVARRAGVTLVAMRSLDEANSEDGTVVSCAHRVGAVGSYRQLARFLNAIQAAPGIVGLEELEILRDEDALDDVLRASLRVTWYAAGPGPDAAAMKGEEG